MKLLLPLVFVCPFVWASPAEKPFYLEALVGSDSEQYGHDFRGITLNYWGDAGFGGSVEFNQSIEKSGGFDNNGTSLLHSGLYAAYRHDLVGTFSLFGAAGIGETVLSHKEMGGARLAGSQGQYESTSFQTVSTRLGGEWAARSWLHLDAVYEDMNLGNGNSIYSTSVGVSIRISEAVQLRTESEFDQGHWLAGLRYRF